MLFAANNVTEPFAPLMLGLLVVILISLGSQILPKCVGLLDLIPDGGGDGLVVTFVGGWIGFAVLCSLISG